MKIVAGANQDAHIQIPPLNTDQYSHIDTVQLLNIYQPLVYYYFVRGFFVLFFCAFLDL